jgi:uncharacterized protein (TIGR02001 family)
MLRIVVAVAAAAVAAPAFALPDASLFAEVANDHRRRGLSWSGGKPAVEVAAGLQASGFRLDVGATSLRNSRRHGGADAGVDTTLSYRYDTGPLQLDANVSSHSFIGGNGKRNYVELGLGAGKLIGPAEVGVLARYAPDQAAIGGDNLYLAARARIALVGTPLTLAAGIGRSTGKTDDAVRAARLRPGGDYNDWSLGLDHVRGPVTIGLGYTGTDVPRRLPTPLADPRYSGDRLVARLGISF